MKRPTRAEQEARIRELDAERRALIQEAEAEQVADERAISKRGSYEERRLEGVRAFRRLQQWLRALEIVEGDANDEPLRKLVAQSGLEDAAWPPELRARIAAAIVKPPRRKRGNGTLKVEAAGRAALRAVMEAERRAFDDNRLHAEQIANQAQCEVSEVIRALERGLAERKAKLAENHGISIDRLEKIVARNPRKSSKRV